MQKKCKGASVRSQQLISLYTLNSLQPSRCEGEFRGAESSCFDSTSPPPTPPAPGCNLKFLSHCLFFWHRLKSLHVDDKQTEIRCTLRVVLLSCNILKFHIFKYFPSNNRITLRCVGQIKNKSSPSNTLIQCLSCMIINSFLHKIVVYIWGYSTIPKKNYPDPAIFIPLIFLIPPSQSIIL